MAGLGGGLGGGCLFSQPVHLRPEASADSVISVEAEWQQALSLTGSAAGFAITLLDIPPHELVAGQWGSQSEVSGTSIYIYIYMLYI